MLEAIGPVASHPRDIFPCSRALAANGRPIAAAASAPMILRRFMRCPAKALRVAARIEIRPDHTTQRTCPSHRQAGAAESARAYRPKVRERQSSPACTRQLVTDFRTMSWAQSAQRPQFVATPNVCCRSASVRAPSSTAARISRSVMLLQRQTYMMVLDAIDNHYHYAPLTDIPQPGFCPRDESRPDQVSVWVCR